MERQALPVHTHGHGHEERHSKFSAHHGPLPRSSRPRTLRICVRGRCTDTLQHTRTTHQGRVPCTGRHAQKWFKGPPRKMHFGNRRHPLPRTQRQRLGSHPTSMQNTGNTGTTSPNDGIGATELPRPFQVLCMLQPKLLSGCGAVE